MTLLALESVLRSLLMAATVWTGIKLLRVSSVLAQKVAWGLVLLCSFAMPFLMRYQVPNIGMNLALPAHHTLPTAPLVATAKVATVELAPTPKESFAVATPLDATAPLERDTRPSASRWNPSELVRFVVPVYLTVSGFLLLRLVFGLAVALRIWNRADLASPILEPRASVRVSASLQSPVTIGSGIVLPTSYTDWDRAKLRLVLAHERAHVRQGDFYLQLLASVYAALVWFSPLGWWLKRELADLGEAISDRAALAEIEDRPSYAQVLLEFAAMPRRSFIGVSPGVGMARSSNIQNRIDRILNDGKFRLAFLGGRRHAVTATVLVPIALIAATSLVRVQAAQVVAVAPKIADEVSPASPAVMPKVAAVPPVAAMAKPIPVSPIAQASFAPSSSSQSSSSQSSSSQSSSDSRSGSSSSYSSQDVSGTITYSQDGGDSYAIVSGASGHVIGQGEFGDEFQRVRRTMQGDYIWVERNGKSYVITDPALIAKGRDLYKPEEELGRRQAALGASQAILGEQQATLGKAQSEVKLPPVDMTKELANLEESLKEVQALKTQEVSQKDLAEVQARLGELQAKLGAAEAKISVKQAEFGRQQAEIGKQQAELSRQQAAFGRQQAKLAREASQQMRALIDGAFRNGQAKPVN